MNHVKSVCDIIHNGQTYPAGSTFTVTERCGSLLAVIAPDGQKIDGAPDGYFWQAAVNVPDHDLMRRPPLTTHGGIMSYVTFTSRQQVADALAAGTISSATARTINSALSQGPTAVMAATSKWRHLGIRVTHEEHERITAAAKARGATVSDFVRQIVREGAG